MPPKHHSSYDDDEKRFIIALCTRLGLKQWKVLSDNALPFRFRSALSGIVRWGHGAWLNTDYGKALWEHYAAMSNGDWVRAVEDLRRKVMLRHVGFDNPTLATKFHIYFIACANPPAPMRLADAMHSDDTQPSPQAPPHGMNEQARANRDATVEQIMRNKLASPAAHRDGNSSLNYREEVCKCPIKQCRGKVPPQCTKKLCHSCCKALSIALQVVEHDVLEGGALVPCSLRCLFTGTPRRPGHEVTAEAWSNHFWRHWVSHLRTNPEELEKWKANRLDSNRSDSPPRSRQRTSIGQGVASAAQPQVQLQPQDRPEQQPQPQPQPQPPAQPQPQLHESNVHRQPEPQAPTSVQPRPITEHQVQPQAQAQPQLPTDQHVPHGSPGLSPSRKLSSSLLVPLHYR